jgi:hypothetical protein
VGEAVDLARSSVPVLAARRAVSCTQLLQGERSLRVLYRDPPEAFDLDIATGRTSSIKLVPAALGAGCPQLSPDGRRLPYQRERRGARAQIMLSPHADGSDAEVVTEGDYPQWFSSGKEILYRLDNTRAAVFALGKGQTMVSEDGASARRLYDSAVSEDGSRIAVLSTQSDRRRTTVDLYEYPSAKLIQRWFLAPEPTMISFDRVRRSWQVSSRRGRNLERCELTKGGDCSLLARLPGTDLVSSLRSELGLLLFAARPTHSTVVRSQIDGAEREYFDDQLPPPDIADTGDALFTILREDGRQVVALQRWNERTPRPLTSGELDVHPVFASSQKAFLYVRAPDQAIVLCDLEEQAARSCRILVSDPLGPSFPRMSPDGKRLAYVTVSGATPHVRIVSLDGSSPRRDFEVAVDQGWYLRWSSSSTLWSCGHGTGWEERDATNWEPTGKRRPAIDAVSVCQTPPPGTGQPARFDVQRTRSLTFEILLARGL